MGDAAGRAGDGKPAGVLVRGGNIANDETDSGDDEDSDVESDEGTRDAELLSNEEPEPASPALANTAANNG